MIGEGMRRWACVIGWLGLAVAPGSWAEPARGQGAVAFQPVIGTFPDGVILNVTPVVSADRRYVRLGVSPQFTGLIGFDTFEVPAAVTGGGIGGGFGGGGGLGGGFGGGGGVGGGLGFGGGFASVGSGPLMAPGGYQVPRFDPSFGPSAMSGAGSAEVPRAVATATSAAEAAPPRARRMGRAAEAYRRAELARMRAAQRAAAAYAGTLRSR
jgi:hypothetical protein